jgi:hypothetical protein
MSSYIFTHIFIHSYIYLFIRLFIRLGAKFGKSFQCQVYDYVMAPMQLLSKVRVHYLFSDIVCVYLSPFPVITYFALCLLKVRLAYGTFCVENMRYSEAVVLFLAGISSSFALICSLFIHSLIDLIHLIPLFPLFPLFPYFPYSPIPLFPLFPLFPYYFCCGTSIASCGRASHKGGQTARRLENGVKHRLQIFEHCL